MNHRILLAGTALAAAVSGTPAHASVIQQTFGAAVYGAAHLEAHVSGNHSAGNLLDATCDYATVPATAYTTTNVKGSFVAKATVSSPTETPVTEVHVYCRVYSGSRTFRSDIEPTGGKTTLTLTHEETVPAGALVSEICVEAYANWDQGVDWVAVEKCYKPGAGYGDAHVPIGLP